MFFPNTPTTKDWPTGAQFYILFKKPGNQPVELFLKDEVELCIQLDTLTLQQDVEVYYWEAARAHNSMNKPVFKGAH